MEGTWILLHVALLEGFDLRLLQTQKRATVTITMTSVMITRVDPVTTPATEVTVSVLNSLDVPTVTALTCNMRLAKVAKTIGSIALKASKFWNGAANITNRNIE